MKRKFELGVLLTISQIMLTTRSDYDFKEYLNPAVYTLYHAAPPVFYNRNYGIVGMRHPYVRNYQQFSSIGSRRNTNFKARIGHKKETEISLYPYLNMTSITMIGSHGETVVGYFTRPDGPQGARAAFNISAMSFTVHTRKDPKGTLFRNAKDLKDTSFNPKKKTKFVTHGWMSEGNSDTCMEIKDGYLANYDVNVVILNWGAIAGDVYYANTVQSVPKVSKHYGILINDIIKTFSIDPKDFHVIGHSLGAHVSGLVYKQLEGKQLGRVTALDPAFPGFDNIVFSNDRVSNKSAVFVDVIHSCGGLLGILEPVGHADFYPNSGIAAQPGCSVLSLYYACSHGRSWKFFADSVAFPKRKFHAIKCENWEKFLQHDCDDSEHIVMGEQVSQKARGKYYLRTNPNPPFPILEN